MEKSLAETAEVMGANNSVTLRGGAVMGANISLRSVDIPIK